MYRGKLLSKSIKTMKSDKSDAGYLTRILYLSPYTISGTNLCPHASKGCAAACLNKAGFGFYPSVQKGRLDKTMFYLEHREEFLNQLEKEIANFERLCLKKDKLPAIRLNGTSDIRWEKIAPKLFTTFPNIQFYDYTKNPKRMISFCEGFLPPNYHLTFSRSESNEESVRKILKAGGNVAIVFKVDINHNIPKTYQGVRVFSGDDTDLRFLDKKGVVGLSAKGVGRSDTSGFILYRKRKMNGEKSKMEKNRGVR
jgi:hypothetical protein